MNKHEFIASIYQDPSNPAGLSGYNKLLRAVRQQRKDITASDVRSYLITQESYTRHGNIPNRYIKRPILVSKPGLTVASDIADFTESSREFNDGHRYILVLIDAFSRKLWAISLTNKNASTLSKVLDNFFSEHSFRYMWTDRGSEYVNILCEKIYKKHNVIRYSTQNSLFKSSLAERVIRTVKSKLHRAMTQFNTNRYIDYLPEIVKSYNMTKHAGLCGEYTPNQAHSLQDPQKIMKLQSSSYIQKFKNYGSHIYNPKSILNLSQRDILKPRTYVRLLMSHVDNSFVKSYKPLFTIEIFQILRVEEGIPTIYYLQDLMGEPITGCCYRTDLSPTSLPDYFPIEKVISTKVCPKTKKNIYFVKYFGWPDKFSSWTESIRKIANNV